MSNQLKMNRKNLTISDFVQTFFYFISLVKNEKKLRFLFFGSFDPKWDFLKFMKAQQLILKLT